MYSHLEAASKNILQNNNNGKQNMLKFRTICEVKRSERKWSDAPLEENEKKAGNTSKRYLSELTWVRDGKRKKRNSAKVVWNVAGKFSVEKN